MALVCLERVPITAPADAIAFASYHATWGHFTFGQSLRFVYDDTKTYVSEGQFTIRGTFTINAETRLAGAPPASDSQAFNWIYSRYEALEELFTTKARQDGPDSLDDYGTAADPRVIPLPSPLFDAAGNVVYAMPGSIEVEQSRFPEELTYVARLTEAKRPTAMLRLGTRLLSGATVDIIPPQPDIRETRMSGGIGTVLTVRNYSRTRLSISAPVPNLASEVAPLAVSVRQFLEELCATGRIDVGAEDIGPSGVQQHSLWSGVRVQSPSADVQWENNQIVMNMQGVV